MVRPGDLTNSVYYVEKGCLRSYLVDSNGKEHIFQFAPEDWVISDEEALSDRKPALFFIDAIEDSIVRIANQPDHILSDIDRETALEVLESLRRKVNAFRRRIIELLCAPADKRYSSFLQSYPDLAQRVPQKMIASYLGITPESLSRVRKDLLTKKQ